MSHDEGRQGRGMLSSLKMILEYNCCLSQFLLGKERGDGGWGGGKNEAD